MHRLLPLRTLIIALLLGAIRALCIINAPDSRPTITTASTASNPYLIMLTQDERIFFQGTPVSLERLAARLHAAGVRSDAPLLLRADRDVSYTFIVRVLDALSGYGFGRNRFPLLAMLCTSDFWE